ncbi:MAG: uracil-DNA glycosylase [Chloroflexi bacterium]|nr:uracil-DNA glycosylase [Chloroflexota bacterium]
MAPGSVIKREALEAVEREARQRGAQVLGEGDMDAPLALVGEAPGEEEVAAGRPFQGPAGRVLDRLLDLAGIPRHRLWITNAVKIRPVARGDRRLVNRSPRPEEVETFRDLLFEEIRIIHPRVVLCLGSVAASVLIHPDFHIGQERGRWFPGPDGIRVTATYHPAYLLRLRGPTYEAVRDAVVADLLRAWGEATASDEHT